MDSVWGADHLKRNEVFNDQLKEMFEEELMAQSFVRMVDFPDGDNWKVSTLGELPIDQVSEGVSLPERRPDTGQFVLNVNQFVGTKVPFSDKFLEDDFLAPAALAAIPRKMKRAFDEYFETEILKLHRVQTNDDPNTINTADHRLVASGTARTITVQDIAYARFAMQKAKVPLGAMVAIVDPSFEFNTNVTATITDISFNPRWEGIIETGIGDGSGLRFIRNIYGFDILVSDFLDKAETAESALTEYDGTATTHTIGDTANMFFTVADQDAMPFIGAWRRQPRVTSWRDDDIETEYHQLTARFGLNLWRPESLVTIFASQALTAA